MHKAIDLSLIWVWKLLIKFNRHIFGANELMACCSIGGKPLPEPIMINIWLNITGGQCINSLHDMLFWRKRFVVFVFVFYFSILLWHILLKFILKKDDTSFILPDDWWSWQMMTWRSSDMILTYFDKFFLVTTQIGLIHNLWANLCIVSS